MKPRISTLTLMSAFAGLSPDLQLNGMAHYMSQFHIRSGKGRGHVSGKSFHNAYSYSKYDPHQGKRECARRVKQLSVS